MSWMPFENIDASSDQVKSFAESLLALQAFKDAFASATPDAATLDQLTADLDRWTNILTPLARPERDRLVGRIPSLPARGHAVIPPYVVTLASPDQVEAEVTFGAAFMGGGGAAHGGMIMTVFDEIMGIQASLRDRTLARTAYLKVDFRATVPVDAPVRIKTWFERVDGRKRFLLGEMWNGDVLCAEANALFVELPDAAFLA